MTTSLQKQKAMDIAMPIHGQSEPVGESRTMTVCLGKDNKVMWYLGMPENPLVKPQLVDYSKAGLRAALIKTEKDIAKSTGKSMIVILKPSSHSVYGNVVNAIDELNITNVSSYAVAEISPKDIDMLKQKNAY
jgi:hypothetical protein